MLNDETRKKINTTVDDMFEMLQVLEKLGQDLDARLMELERIVGDPDISRKGSRRIAEKSAKLQKKMDKRVKHTHEDFDKFIAFLRDVW